MVKRAFLVHGWGGSPNGGWYPWLKEELENNGFEVYSLDMPNTEFPVIEEWVSHLAKEVKNPDKDTYFIGHSIGCQAIMRYLQGINRKVGGALFVAGWFYLANLEENEIETAEPWLNTPIDFDKLKENLGKISVLISDNDPFDCLDENVKAFKEKLGAKVIIEKNKEHFNNDKYDIILKEFMELAK